MSEQNFSEQNFSERSFEPFGEPIAAGSAPRRAGALLARFGVGVFWTLVAAIVVARALYFSPQASSFFVAALDSLRGLAHI